MEQLARVLARWVSVFAWLLLVVGAAFFAASL